MTAASQSGTHHHNIEPSFAMASAAAGDEHMSQESEVIDTIMKESDKLTEGASCKSFQVLGRNDNSSCRF